MIIVVVLDSLITTKEEFVLSFPAILVQMVVLGWIKVKLVLNLL